MQKLSSSLMKKKSIDRILLQGSLVSFVLKIGGVLSSFALQVFLARSLDPKGFGDYVFVLTIVNFVVLLGSLGLDKAAVKFLPQYVADRTPELAMAFQQYAVRLTFFAGLFFSFVLAVLAFYWQGFDEGLRNCLLLGALLIHCNLYIQWCSGVFQANRKISLSSYPQNILRPLLVIMLVVLASVWLPASAEMVVAVSVVSGFLVLAFMTLLSDRVRRGAGAKVIIPWREWLEMAVPMMFISGLNLIMSQADIFMLGVMLDTASAGIYSAATKLALLVTFVLTSVNVIAAPLIAEMWAKRDLDGVQHIVSRTSATSFFVAIGGCIFIFVLRDGFLALYGPEFLAARDALAILLAAQMLNAAVGCAGYVMIMTGHQRSSLMILAAAAVVNVILNIFLIPEMKLVGAAIATFVSTLVMCAMLAWYTNTIIGINSTFIRTSFISKAKL